MENSNAIKRFDEWWVFKDNTGSILIKTCDGFTQEKLCVQTDHYMSISQPMLNRTFYY